MNLLEIKKAILEGKTVHWSNESYIVIKDDIGQYLIKCISNESCIGLTHKDEVTMNGQESEFFIKE